MPVKYENDCVKISPLDNQFVLLTLDMPGSSANVLTEKMFADLDEAWDQIADRAAEIRGVVIRSAKEKIFVAGADLVRVARTLDWPDEKIN